MRDVIVRLGDGQARSLGDLYDAHVEHVERYLRRLVGNRHDAEDLTQQVFLKLIFVVGRYEARPDVSFRSWLLRVAHNIAIDFIRAPRPLPVCDVADRRAAIEARDDTAACLHEALAELPDDQREVVILRHVSGLTPPEIASALGRTEASVHGLHNRGRGRLRDELSRRQVAPSVHDSRRLQAA